MKAQNYYGFDGWDTPTDKTWDGSIKGQFEVADIGPEPEFVYAVYSTPSYEGSADVVFFRDGQWFHVGGGHCSCYGLEGQWEPKPLDPREHLEALKLGKSLLLVYDTENDYPEATKEAFDAWLEWAAEQSCSNGQKRGRNVDCPTCPPQVSEGMSENGIG